MQRRFDRFLTRINLELYKISLLGRSELSMHGKHMFGQLRMVDILNRDETSCKMLSVSV